MTGTPDLIAGFIALDATRNEYLTRWAYFAGPLPERFSNQAIQQLMDRATPDTQYRFRLAKVPVNALKNRVQIASVTGQSDEITNRIEQIRQANDLELIEPFITERTLVYGDAYAYTSPIEPEDETLPADLRTAGVEIRYASPLSVRAMYDSEDGTRLRYVIRRWKEIDPIGTWRWKVELWYPAGYMEPWVCQDGATGTDVESWREDLDASGDWPMLHDYGMPFHHARTSLPYGRPEHADAMGPQDAFTKAIVTQVAVELDAHSLPERWELIKAQNPDTARDAIQWADDEASAPAAKPGVSGSGRRRGPGTVSILEGRDGTGEYRAPNPSDLVPAMDHWLRMMAVVTETPAHEYDPAGNAGLSGAARRWADKPLDVREKNVKRALTTFWRSVWASALDMVGLGNRSEVDIEWASAGVILDPDWWEVATARRDHGVPQDVILREANYPADEVKKWLDQQGEAMAMAHRIRMVKELAEGLSTLGSAVALGVLPQEKADALVSRIMGEVTTGPEAAAITA